MKSQPILKPQEFVTFGALLRYLRERVHLTQRELADLVGYHDSYISYLEKNLRVPDEATLLGRFVPALDLENKPDVIARLLELIANKSKKLSGPEAQPIVSVENPYHLPPSLTSMLGREREAASLLKMLRRADVRLITIVGPPGVGKTCLAQHIAELAEKYFAKGVVLVNLAPVLQPELVLSAMAAALGIQKFNAENLKSALHKKNMLVVLDNFEQVVEAAPLLLPVLGDAPGLKILVTSRESLRVRGEYEFPLEPLPVPDDSFLDSAAVQLFIERASAVKPDFKLDDSTAAHVAQICRRLDGLPLAIELAAARVRTLSLPAMIEQLDHRFEWLTRGGRDLPIWRQSLLGALEWSYNLLSNQERALFNRLSVFTGGWDIEAAESVCSDDTLCTSSDVLGLLMQLVDKSLVVADVESRRFQFLETLREFAHEKFVEGKEIDSVRRRHCEYYLKFAQTARPYLLEGGDQTYWLRQIDLEYGNLRSALGWVVETPDRAIIAMDLAMAIHVFWMIRSSIREARSWFSQILALDPTPRLVRANLLRFACDYASSQADYAAAQSYEEEGLAISKALGDEEGINYSMDGLAVLAGRQGNYARAAELLEQVLVYRRRTDDMLRLTSTLNNLALANRRTGNTERAMQIYEEVIALSQATGNIRSLSNAQNGMAEVYVKLEKYAEALDYLRPCLAIRQQLGNLNGISTALGAMAVVADQMDAKLLAVQLESVSIKLRDDAGIVLTHTAREEDDEFVARLRAQLSKGAFDKAWASGQKMSLEQVIELALDETQISKK